MFPIGIGSVYDVSELSVLGRHGKQDNTLHLNNMDQLRIFLTLDSSYSEKICRGAYRHKPVFSFYFTQMEETFDNDNK